MVSKRSMKNRHNKLLVFILGPTAVGKTDLSIELAEQFETEILSADSRQFYRELEIGTAKPSKKELEKVKHHFINSHSIKDDYNVYDFESEAITKLDSLFASRDVVLMTGGSGLYLHAIWHGFDKSLPGSDLILRDELNQDLEKYGIENLLKRLKSLDPDAEGSIDVKNPVRIMRAIEICMLSGKPLNSIQ